MGARGARALSLLALRATEQFFSHEIHDGAPHARCVEHHVYAIGEERISNDRAEPPRDVRVGRPEIRPLHRAVHVARGEPLGEADCRGVGALAKVRGEKLPGVPDSA